MGEGGGEGNQNYVPPIELEHLLIRFLDVDVRPGYTYQYQMRVRMLNPNFEKKSLVSNPQYAARKVLTGPWVMIGDPIPVPAESFVYASDPVKYSEDIKKDVRDRFIRQLLDVKEGQTTVEIQSWMEQVKAGGKREPVGTWVVGEMPVSRGDYIGKKQFLKLPLWSSEQNNYVLRDIAEQGAFPKQVTEKPKGWLVDFSTRSILVDFEGGKVVAGVGGRTVTDESAVEMLVLRPDGKLIVRSSADDMDKAKEPERAQREKGWDEWVKAVDTGKSAPAPGAPGGGGDFNRNRPTSKN